jgi:hypothetical protein
VIVCLAVSAKNQDQTAGCAVRSPTQAGFVDQGEASSRQPTNDRIAMLFIAESPVW